MNNMKKINFKQPKYIFPLIILSPMVFLGYQIAGLTTDSDEKVATGVVTDSINMSLPDAENKEMGDKMNAMDNRFVEDGGFTAMENIGRDIDVKDTIESGYSELEKARIAERNERQRQREEAQELQRSLNNARRSILGGSSSRRSSYGRNSDIDEYAQELQRIQRTNRERQKLLDGLFRDDAEGREYNGRTADNSAASYIGGVADKIEKKEDKPELVEKVKDKHADKFNTISNSGEVDEPLIKAMIDQTTKAHEGTRIRFKLLDDVVIKKIKIKKGTYLYGVVTGFGQQRVMVTISSILVKDKFIKVNLSVFDNDGLEGFYVPESAFRSMMKEAGSQAVQNNINFNGGYGSEISGEAIALQALQNMYQSASNAVSANIRKNRAKIKYNTIVYLVNTSLN